MIEKLLNPATEYGDVFPNDLSKIKEIYRDLCRSFHPDVCGDPRAIDAFQRIQEFYEQAVAAVSSGTWYNSHQIDFTLKNGKIFSCNFLYRCGFELGEYFVGKTNIFYVIDKEKYITNFENQKITFKDDNMRKMFDPIFPKIKDKLITKDDKTILIIQKGEDFYPLRAVIENFYNSKVPAREFAWLITRLLNIACMLNFNNKVSNGINLDAIFVNLKQHDIFLPGIFWYMTNAKQNMIGTTSEIFAIMPPKVKANKVSDISTDIETIKMLGRKWVAADAPAAISGYFASGTKENPVDELQKWETALKEAWGERKFIVIKADEKDIYKKEK